MSISTQHITKVYGTQTVLDNVNIEIAKGEIVGLLGPNGAGKSTLMKILTCFIPPTSGEAFIYGHNVLLDSENVKNKVGYLPENNPLYVDMYIKEYLHFMAGMHKLGKASESRIKDIIEITGLGPEQNKKIITLSKGYRQRVGLAQALIHNPDVLILDEPTSGLDPNQLSDIRNLIREIGKEKTVLLSTHIMQEVEAVCSRAIIINKGKIVADDKTSNLTSFATKNFIVVEFSKVVASEQLMAIPHVKAVKQVNETIWSLEPENNSDIRPGINSFAVEKQLTILSLRQEENSLEQVFHSLTGKIV